MTKRAAARSATAPLPPTHPSRPGSSGCHQRHRLNQPPGALHLPITEPPPSPPGLTRVSGVARVHLPAGSPLTADDVAVLGRVVEQRCPIAAMLAAAGVEMDMEWVPGGAAPL